MRKYESVTRFGKRGTGEIFNTGELIVVEEKLDGANASMTVVDGTVQCFSRNTVLDAHNTLRGFYQYAQGLYSVLEEGYIYYGEWLVPHTIKYPEEYLNHFYLFDIYDIEEDKYLSSRSVAEIGTRSGMYVVPKLSIGKFSSVGEVMEFVGSSNLAESGEGVVLKYWNSEKREVVKIVSDKFKESKGLPKQKVAGTSDSLHEFVSATVTEPRIEKLLNKLVDEGKIPEEYDLQDMPVILKSLGSSVYDDVMKEEADVLENMLKKKIGKFAPPIVKQVIAKRNAD
jgi:RNA ligase